MRISSEGIAAGATSIRIGHSLHFMNQRFSRTASIALYIPPNGLAISLDYAIRDQIQRGALVF